MASFQSLFDYHWSWHCASDGSLFYWSHKCQDRPGPADSCGTVGRHCQSREGGRELADSGAFVKIACLRLLMYKNKGRRGNTQFPNCFRQSPSFIALCPSVCPHNLVDRGGHSRRKALYKLLSICLTVCLSVCLSLSLYILSLVDRRGHSRHKPLCKRSNICLSV